VTVLTHLGLRDNDNFGTEGTESVPGTVSSCRSAETVPGADSPQSQSGTTPKQLGQRGLQGCWIL
jgi:hypothetical protein